MNKKKISASLFSVLLTSSLWMFFLSLCFPNKSIEIFSTLSRASTVREAFTDLTAFFLMMRKRSMRTREPRRLVQRLRGIPPYLSPIWKKGSDWLNLAPQDMLFILVTNSILL